MTQEVVDRLLVRIKSVIFTPDPVMPLFSGAIQDPQDDLEKALNLDRKLLDEIKATDEISLHENATYFLSVAAKHQNIINKVDDLKKQSFKNITQFNKNQKNIKKYQNV